MSRNSLKLPECPGFQMMIMRDDPQERQGKHLSLAVTQNNNFGTSEGQRQTGNGWQGRT